jgi:hypothetical protein
VISLMDDFILGGLLLVFLTDYFLCYLADTSIKATDYLLIPTTFFNIDISDINFLFLALLRTGECYVRFWSDNKVLLVLMFPLTCSTCTG